MTTTLEAVYEGGILKLAEALDLPEHQRVRITVEPLSMPAADRDAARKRLVEGLKNSNVRLTGPIPTRDELHERF